MPAVDPPRPLTVVEERVLRFLLTSGGREAEPYLLQVPALRVKSLCGCGCPSVIFDSPGEGLEEMAWAKRPDFDPGVGRVVLVVQGDDQGRIATLDLEWTTPEPVAEWPPLEDLTVEWSGLPDWFLADGDS